MWKDALLAYLHFFAIFGTFSALSAELVMCRPGIRGDALHRLRKLDGAYGGLAALLLVSGLLRLFFGAKGSAFYLGNPVFYAKVAVFAVVGLLSIPPTMRFGRWSKAALRSPDAAPDAAEVAAVRRTIHIELTLLALIPLLATLMARGI
jgi:putative membrane protein